MIPVTSVHTAVLTVPNSADPARKVVVSDNIQARTVTITAQGDTPALARQAIRQFLSDALAAVDAPAAP